MFVYACYSAMITANAMNERHVTLSKETPYRPLLRSIGANLRRDIDEGPNDIASAVERCLTLLGMCMVGTPWTSAQAKRTTCHTLVNGGTGQDVDGMFMYGLVRHEHSQRDSKVMRAETRNARAFTLHPSKQVLMCKGCESGAVIH